MWLKTFQLINDPFWLYLDTKTERPAEHDTYKRTDMTFINYWSFIPCLYSSNIYRPKEAWSLRNTANKCQTSCALDLQCLDIFLFIHPTELITSFTLRFSMQPAGYLSMVSLEFSTHEEDWNSEKDSDSVHIIEVRIAQFRYINIQPKIIGFSTRLWG